MIESPVFLVGAERSGTTMLRLMLDFHPRIGWLNEFEYAVDLVGVDGLFPTVERYEAFLETERSFQQNRFEIDRTLSYPELVDSFLMQKAVRSGDPDVIGATVHRNFARLIAIWPRARFIHIVRDPRDVARSCVNMGWFGNVWKGAQFWIDAERQWSAFRGALPEDRFIEVRYETLVGEAERELRRICEFLGVAYDAAMFDYAAHTTYDRPDPGLAEQWRRKLSPRACGLVEQRVGPLLAERGYEASGAAPPRMTLLRKAALHVHNRVGQALFRLRRYGFRIVASGYVASRLRIDAWQKRVRHEVNRIDAAHLK